MSRSNCRDRCRDFVRLAHVGGGKGHRMATFAEFRGEGLSCGRITIDDSDRGALCRKQARRGGATATGSAAHQSDFSFESIGQGVTLPGDASTSARG